MASDCIAEMPDRLLRMDPASLGLRLAFGSRIRLGKAKSKAVKVELLRSSCGEGMTVKVSKDDASGVKARTAGE